MANTNRNAQEGKHNCLISIWKDEQCQVDIHAMQNFLSFKNILFIYFREMGREGEREEEKHQCARDTSIGCFSCALY